MLTKKKKKKSDALLARRLVAPLKRLLALLPAGNSDAPTPSPKTTALPAASPLSLADGATLPISRWSPLQRPRAVLLALHGLNGHRGNFTELGEIMQRHGLALYAYDQRGFGENVDRGEWPGGNLLVNDLVEVVRRVAAVQPDIPLFLLGESLGTTVILLALADKPELPVAGAVLVAPTVMERDSVSPLLRLFVWLGARLFPWLTLSQENSVVPLAKNPALLAQIRQDPHMLQATRIDTLEAVYRMMYRAMEAAPTVRRPVRLIYGGRDKVVPAKAAERLQQVLPQATASYYPEGYHLLLHDIEAPAIQREILAWISAHAQSGLSRSTSR